MQVQQVLLSLRSKLRDKDFNGLKHSDNELLDLILVTQNMLILQFDYNVREFVFTLENDDRVFLNKEILGLKKVELNTKELPIKPQDLALIYKEPLCAFLRGARIVELNQQVSGSLKVLANCGEEAIDKEGDLTLDFMFFNALVLGVLKRIILTETGIDNLEKVTPYEQLYKNECAMLTKLLNQRNAQRILTSRCVLI